MKNFIIKFGSTLLVIAVVCAGIWHFKTFMADFCLKVGQSAGSLTGTAVGSFSGRREGNSDGKDAGKDAGLSAKDTTVDIVKTVQDAGELEILSADVFVQNLNKISDVYEGLSVVEGHLVFTVDLSHADISVNPDDGSICVVISTPKHNFFLNENSTRKLAEKQKFTWKINAEDGINAYLNSKRESVNKISENILNYEELVQSARDSAVKQVEQLVSAVSVSHAQVQVSISDEEAAS